MNCSRALSARVAAMADEIERLELTAITCMEHAESLRHRIGRLEETVADVVDAEPAATAATSPAASRNAIDVPPRAGRAGASGNALAPVRVPVRFKHPPDIGHVVSTMLYAASAALVGTLLSFAL